MKWMPACARMMLAASLLSYCGAAAAFQLVTEGEMAEMQKLLRDFRDTPSLTRSFVIDQGPRIELVSPNNFATSAPVRVVVQFAAVDGRDVDPKSLKVFYGIGPFKKDVTDRVMKNARLSKDGLVMENVEAPKGTHRFILQISDTEGHAAQREIRIEIV